ncbi:MAG: thioredoxin [Candidatus Doudnabacteria bacterium]|nr:thioredoxin [Candidatus Doudnabacteria bacterium]
MDTNSKIVTATAENFDTEVMKSDIPVLVDFWASWCQPCLRIAPTLEKLSTELEGKLKIVKLNVDEYPQIAGQYGIMSIPNLKFFNKGEYMGMGTDILGAIPEPMIRSHIDKVLSGVGDSSNSELPLAA